MPKKGNARRRRRERNGSLQSNQNPSKLVHQPYTTTNTLGAWEKGPPQTILTSKKYTGGYSNSACSSVPKGAWGKGSSVKDKNIFYNTLLTNSEKTSDDDGFFPWVKEYLEKESNS